MALLKRFPKRDQTISVYAVGVAILFSWAIITTFNVVINQWGLYLDITEIFGLFAYIMAGAFVESLLLIASLLLFGFILPQKLFLDKFVLRGTILTITFLGSIMYLYAQTTTFEVLANINTWGIFFAICTVILLLLGEVSQFVARVVETMADRCIVFLYIYLPASFISYIIIFVRNLG
ncbi:MAG: hypothetical protein HYZ21_16275 [Chloroflexi bacterium]|nr:hypothetical protein [Chloroflexota bacterium]